MPNETPLDNTATLVGKLRVGEFDDLEATLRDFRDRIAALEYNFQGDDE